MAAVIALIVVSARYALLKNELHKKPEGDDDYRNEYVFHLNSFGRSVPTSSLCSR
jgi:hypothetical protein